MSAYVKQLQEAAAREQAMRDSEKKVEMHAARDRLTPLEDRLKKVLSTIPPEMQRDGLSLRALQAQLKGRWRGSAHPGEVGTALRKLGYQRRRQWSGGEGFKALWYPPCSGVH